jgi:hypothetical protein
MGLLWNNNTGPIEHTALYVPHRKHLMRLLVSILTLCVIPFSLVAENFPVMTTIGFILQFSERYFIPFSKESIIAWCKNP